MKNIKKGVRFLFFILILIHFTALRITASAEDAGWKTEAAAAEKNLSAPDFSSRRLLVSTTDESILKAEDRILSSYDGVYLLQFEEEDDAREAYAYYLNNAVSVEADANVMIAEALPEEAVLGGTVMSESENPLAKLKEILNSETEAGGVYDIALIDTGADCAAEAKTVLSGAAFDDHGHGTLMAEYILEQNPDASILSVKALDENGIGSVSDIFAAINLAMETDVRIINLSVSAEMSEGSRILETVIREAAAKGIAVVGAAGNNGAEASAFVPGGIDEAMIAGAAKENGERTPSSNYGDTVDYNIVADFTSASAAKLSGWLSANSPETVGEVLNQGLIYETDYTAGDVSVEICWGKGTVEQVVDRSYSVMPEEGYRIWRTAGLSRYLDYYQPLADENGCYVIDPAVKTFRVYFLSDAEYEQILQSAGSEEHLKYYWDDPQWFFRYGTRVLSDDEFEAVYGEYYAHQAAKRKASGQFETAWIFGVPAGTQIISQKLDHTPEVGQTLTARACGLEENNRADGVDDTWNDYVFSIDSGYGAGQKIHLNCAQNGGWFPVSNGTLHFQITYVDPQTHTFGGNVYWNSDDSREQPQANTFQGSYVPPEGLLTLVKSSAAPSVTEGNRCYSLEGAEYTVYFDDACTEAAGTLTTKADGTTNTLSLKPGTYYVRETRASRGYTVSDKVIFAKVTADETFTAKDAEQPGFDAAGIEIAKVSGSAYPRQYPLEGTQFAIRYYDNMDGDVSGVPLRTWILETVAGKDGSCRAFLDTESLTEAYIGDVKCENPADAFYYADGQIVLPLGTVSVEETVPARGYTLTGAVLKDSDGREILLTDGKYISTVTLKGGVGKLSYGNFYTMLNTPVEIHTAAVNEANGLHYAEAGKAVTIVDTVTMNGTDTERLVNNHGEWDFVKYRLVAQVKVAGSKEAVPLKNANDETGTKLCRNFVTEDFDGHRETMKLQIEDTAAYEGQTLYVSEELYAYVTKNGKEGNTEKAVLIACEDESIFPDLPEEHKETQRIHFPSIATALAEDETHTHTANAQRAVSVTDTVSYQGLIAGGEYVLQGVLMSKTTGKPAKDADGSEIKAKKSFVAAASEGIADLTFRFANPDLAGDTLVAFEELFEGDIRIGAHEDIDEEGQSVHLPSVETELTLHDTSKSFRKTDALKLKDTVRLNNIEPHTVYLVKGYLVNQKTGNFLLKDGREAGSKQEAYSETAEFFATDREALLPVSFEIDASEIGFDIVCYEELYAAGQDGKGPVRLVAEHADIESAAQTVRSGQELPKTGDERRASLWMVLMVTGLLGVVVVSAVLVKKSNGR